MKYQKLIFLLQVLCIGCLWLNFGCSYRIVAKISPQRTLEKQIKNNIISKIEELNKSKDNITLQDTLALALIKNPELSVYSLEIRAREAKALQASLLSNPEIEFEMDNLISFENNETSIWLGQLIEVGGKIKNRVKLAAFESDLAAWDYEAKRLEILTSTAKAFNTVLYTQKLVKLNEELVEMSKKLINEIEVRVKIGKVSPAELLRVQVGLSLMRIKLKNSQSDLDSARQRLSKILGTSVPGFKKAIGKLERLNSIPSIQKLNKLIQNNPSIARSPIELQYREADLKLQKAKRFPDPTIKIGYRRMNENDENALQAGVSIPLVLFNHNQGSIKEAEVRKKQTEKKRQTIMINLLNRLKILHNSLLSAHQEVKILQEKTLSKAEKAYDIINNFYQRGRHSFLDVLYVKQTIFNVKEQYLNALHKYNQYVIDIEGLIGQSLKNIE